MSSYFGRAFQDMFQFTPPFVLPIFGPIFLIIAIILILKYIKKEFSLMFLSWYLFLLMVTCVYAMGVLLVTRVADIPLSVYQNLLESRDIFYFSTPQLIPFNSLTHILNIYGVGTIILGNLLLLLPLGFLLPLWLRKLRNVYQVGLIVMLTSIVIELLQFLFGVGIPNIDDILLNTIGGLVGYGSCRILKNFIGKS
ncbi:VanZ family protein [Bacillus solitudinis]|uniref:VanZ family protein n=1 Tax=Bacillus solitudinis TaxID=2014074 RepID=UPI000C250350|nr:VanZ family protein [Bacillus solitudinis]